MIFKNINGNYVVVVKHLILVKWLSFRVKNIFKKKKNSNTVYLKKGIKMN